jgi:hypothetical protein
MSIAVVALCVCLVVALVVLRLQQRKLDALPLAVWSLVRKERDVLDDKALARMREASGMLEGIRSYHAQLETLLTTERNDADMRARVVERRSKDAGIALDAASALVGSLRGVLDRLAPASADEGIGDAPEQSATGRRRRPSPAVEPPGSAAPMSPELAQIAAGLGPRPQSARPHAPPRKATLLGIRPPVSLPSAVPEDERLSEEEVTRVADRPAAEVLGSAKTLASMPAVTPHQDKKEGAP